MKMTPTVDAPAAGCGASALRAKKVPLFLAALLVFAGSSGLLMAEKGQAQPKNAGYWSARGDLCAAYGNDSAAVQYYQKALALQPGSSRIHFQLAISLGQLGKFSQALLNFNRAIEMEPQKALYYYGRGRMYLLAGDTQKASGDLERAAALGSQDAQDYLRNPLRP